MYFHQFFVDSDGYTITFVHILLCSFVDFSGLLYIFPGFG